MSLTTNIRAQAPPSLVTDPSTALFQPRALPPETILDISAEARGQLAPEAESSAQAAFREHGCLVLRGLFASALIEAMHADYAGRYGALDARAMLEKSRMPPPNPIVARGEGRYQVTPRVSGAFGAPGVFANPLLRRILTQLLGADMQLSSMTLVVSHPGASLQTVHRDFGHLFAEPGVDLNLPAHAINVVVPLIDVDMQIGPTGVWPGSHRWLDNSRAQLDGMAACVLKRSDCMLLDYRTIHTGLPNQSTVQRPILYMVYARSWFFDDPNHFGTNPLDLSLDEHRRLPASAHPLLARALSQAMRDQGQRSSNGAPDPSSGAKIGRNDPCPCGSGRKYKQCHGKPG